MMENTEMGRRAFLKGAALATAGVAGAGLLATPARALDRPLTYADIPTLKRKLAAAGPSTLVR